MAKLWTSEQTPFFKKALNCLVLPNYGRVNKLKVSTACLLVLPGINTENYFSFRKLKNLFFNKNSSSAQSTEHENIALKAKLKVEIRR